MSVDVHTSPPACGKGNGDRVNGQGDGDRVNGQGDGDRVNGHRGHGLDAATLRRVFGAYPTGVTALAALVAGTPVGMAANSFTSVSLDPPLVSVCVASASTTWPSLRRAARLGVSVLSHEQEHASRSLAARGTDRFAGLAWNPTVDGAVLLAGASAWLDCSVEREIRAGDHEIVLLRVHRLGTDPEVAPLVFHGSRYRRLAA